MSFSKSLTSAVAALTVAGAVGLAYAQSTPDTTTSAPSNANTSQPVNNTTPSSDTSSSMPAPSSTTTTTTTTSSGLDTELQPKADRN
jgi:cytoskeletal protein RodZ